jgi:protein TonB
MGNDLSISRNARAMKRLQRRRHRRHVRASTEARPVPPEPKREKPPEMLSDTLVLTFPHKAKNRWYTVPAAFALHLAVVLALILIPILMPQVVDPQLVLLFVNPAPPPPPPLRMGTQEVREKPTDVVERERPEQTVDPNRLLLPSEIPEDILKPRVDLDYGYDDGYEWGHPFGMEGGVPGGVVGGVPGGIVGGVIGGTGTGVPRLPPADTGPRPIRMPRPTYTVEAIRKKLSGEVVLRVIIDERGKVKVLEITHSIPELDQEAIRVVEREWLFHPATKNGRPVASVAELVVTFNLY